MRSKTTPFSVALAAAMLTVGCMAGPAVAQDAVAVEEEQLQQEELSAVAVESEPMSELGLSMEDVVELGAQDDDVVAGTQATTPHVAYHTHVQTYGWEKAWRRDGEASGTSGEAKRLEGIELRLEDTPVSGGITYRTHVQTYGWQAWKSDGQMSGTSGESKRLEAIEIKLTGQMANRYDVWYRVHAQTYGWMGWAKNGERAGTATWAKRLEAVQIVLVSKGSAGPGATYKGVTSIHATAYETRLLAYRTHVQSYGWQGWVYDGEQSGTSGKSKRLEGIEIRLPDAPYSGGIEYQTHIQSYGWETAWRSDGQMSGTSGQAKRLEAIRIRLTGRMSIHYDVWYRVHAQKAGWMAWACNGEDAGTAGFGYRLEAIQIVLVPKGGAAPSADFGGKPQSRSASFITHTNATYMSLSALGINYGSEVNKKVDAVLGEMTRWCALMGIDYNAGLSNYDKAKGILYYVGTHYSYGDGSYSAESMIDKGYGTCFAYSDLVCCMARKVGLVNSSLCVAGRPQNHGGLFYGSQHRTVVSCFDGKYYDLDGNLAYYGFIDPQPISKSYADYLLGKADSFTSFI